MGSGYGISCSECDYEKNFMVGIGMSYSPQNMMDFDTKFALLPSLIGSKETFSYIKELFRTKNAVMNDYGHSLYRCPKCGEFYEHFFIHLDFEGGSYEVEYKCTKCEVELERIDLDGWNMKELDYKKYFCPKCGNYSLHKSELTMFWD